MKISVNGMGWITPLGSGLDEVWCRLASGEMAEGQEIRNPETGRIHRFADIPAKDISHLGREPRLRRASPISYYSVAAGLAAIKPTLNFEDAKGAGKIAVIFAISSGSVVYTRRFYEGVVKQGAGAASPMLFPETVYNAPASHLAAQLGIDGASYTLVGDSSVGISAVKMAEQLLFTNEVDSCLVVGAEEIDWVLCEAYRDWRFASHGIGRQAYGQQPTGALLAAGAGALLLSRAEEHSSGKITLSAVQDGVAYVDGEGRKNATIAVVEALCSQGKVAFVVGSANGSWCDKAEGVALGRCLPDIPVICPKLNLGEALGAGAIWQIIVAASSLQRGELPGTNFPRIALDSPKPTGAVLCTGINQQSSGLLVSR